MRYGILAALLVLPGVDVPAQETGVTAWARVDSTRYLVGDWIHVRVDFRHPRGAAFRTLIGDTAGGFAVLERQPLLPASDTTTTTGFILAKYDSGRAVVPPIPFSVSLPDDSARTVFTNPIVVTVQTVPVDTTKDFRDLKPPLGIPLSAAEIAMYSGIILLLAAAAFFGYRYWKRRRARRAAGGEAEVRPARPAHIIALEQLAVLKEKKLWEQGQVKEFYSEITEIFRRYLENRYSMMALEETTDEILAGMRKLRFPDRLLGDSERILRRADLVKFAKGTPIVREHEEMFIVVHDVVEKTKVAPMTPVTAAETSGGGHARS
jgi:hypothetical protein